jgi:hypothetical protein
MTAIIVEDGSIVTGANSYVTVSGVGVYALDYGYTTWSTSTATVQTQSLFRGMRYIEGLNFKGFKSTEDQSLAFPRSDLYDKDGYLLEDDTIPLAIVNALCEATILSLPTSDVILQPATNQESYRTKLDIAGAIKEEWNTKGNAIRDKSTIITDMLKGLVYSNNIIVVERG